MRLGVRALREAYAAGAGSPHKVVDEVLRRIEERGADGWVRFPVGWQIVAAHVSEIGAG